MWRTPSWRGRSASRQGFPGSDEDCEMLWIRWMLWNVFECQSGIAMSINSILQIICCSTAWVKCLAHCVHTSTSIFQNNVKILISKEVWPVPTSRQARRRHWGRAGSSCLTRLWRASGRRRPSTEQSGRHWGCWRRQWCLWWYWGWQWCLWWCWGWWWWQWWWWWWW